MIYRLLSPFLLTLVFVLHSALAFAQNLPALDRPFDANRLSWQDKRFLQLALAFQGYYNGLLDGDWGAISQRAFDRYSAETFSERPHDWHMAMLAFDFFDEWDRDGWSIEFFDPVGLSLLFPNNAAVSEPSTDHFVNWRTRNSSLAYSMAASNEYEMLRYHSYALSRHQLSAAPYMVRQPSLVVTSAKRFDGSILYTRSDYIDGVWVTVMLSADRRDEAKLNAVAASITPYRASPILLEEDGYLYRSIEAVINVLDSPNTAEATPSTEISGSGSGFIVDANGSVVTNAHVIAGCQHVSVDGQPAQIIARAEEFDLALLRSSELANREYARFSTTPARLNSDVTVVGYPYSGLLGGLNVTRGAVSSLTGIRGSATTMQITAPVQAGNSGGPVIANDGTIVGVVVSKLDADYVADAIGDVPQNVNFAIRGEIAKLFLSQNGIDIRLGSDTRLEPEILAEIGDNITVYIECFR